MPIATDLAIVNMRLKAGAVRELHWHNETEWGFVLKGRMRSTAIDEEGHAFQDDISEGLRIPFRRRPPPSAGPS